MLRDLVSLGCPVHVVDPDPDAAEAARDLGAASVSADPAGLPGVAGVVVATPATTHAPVVERALGLGVPVFCEKPLTTDPASADRLVRLGGDRLFVMHNWRYHPGVELLGAIARSGELGPVLGLRSVRTNWTSPRRDTDPVWTLVPHDLTLALEILGVIPEPRHALAERRDGVPVGMIATLGTDPWFVLEASTRYREKRREVRLHGRDGVAVLESGETDRLTLLRTSEDPADAAPAVEHRSFDSTPPLLRELTAFVEHLRGGPPPKTGAAEGAAIVRGVQTLRDLAGIGS